jgi:hypothetical protein
MLAKMLMSSRQITFIATASTQTTSNTTSLTISKPTGTLQNDLMIAVMGGGFSGSSSYSLAGWTQVYTRSGSGGLTIFYRVAGASEGASYTFTCTNSNRQGGSIITYRYAAYDTVGTAALDTNPLVAPSITLNNNYSLLLAVYLANSASRTPTTPTNMTSVVSNTDADAPSWAVFSQLLNIGATGTRSSTIGTASNVTGILLSIKPQRY